MVGEQVIPSFAKELGRKELGGTDAASGYGISLTADMHRRGIGIRHMGLLRDMFWRPLQGHVDLSFNSNRVRTKTDMRLQLRRGDKVSHSADPSMHSYIFSALTFTLFAKLPNSCDIMISAMTPVIQPKTTTSQSQQHFACSVAVRFALKGACSPSASRQNTNFLLPASRWTVR